MMKAFRLQRIGLGNVNTYLLWRPGEALLVDCGNPGSEKKILKAMKALGLDPRMLKILVLTHAHFDHAGSAARLKDICHCEVVVHALEADRLRAGRTPFPAGTRWKARVLVSLGRLFARPMMRYPACEPDRILQGEVDLQDEGLPVRVIPAPGHTPGSQLVLTAEGDLISGDSFFGLENKLHFPPFAEDAGRLLDSWKEIRDLDAHTIHPAHGHAFPFQDFLKEYPAALKRYR